MADFGKLTYKHPIERKTAGAEMVETPASAGTHVKKDIRLTAKGLLQHRIERGMERYIVEHADELKGITGSQLGLIASMCINCQYQPEKAELQLGSYLVHSKEKTEHYKKQDEKKKPDSFHRYLEKMLGTDLYRLLEISGEPVMKIPVGDLLSPDEQVRYKLQLMERQIRYANREGRNRG